MFLSFVVLGLRDSNIRTQRDLYIFTWNMPSPGRTNSEAFPGRASNEGREPCSKQALAQVSMGTDRCSYGGKRFFGCPCRGHSPLGGRKIVRVVHSPTNDQATAQSSEVSIACPQKGASANPVWIQAWHSERVMSLSSLPFETIAETTFQYAATNFSLISHITGSWDSPELSGIFCQSSSRSGGT